MIHVVDATIRAALLASVPGLTDARIGFQPPDADWRGRMVNVADTSINVHLALIDEDAGLRSNAVRREPVSGVLSLRRAPERVRLHYILSAWSPASDSPQTPATENEHALLGAVLAGLFASSPLNAFRVLPAAEALALPEAFRQDLPTTVAHDDEALRLGEFWSTMGRPQAWKPVVSLVVTMPVVSAPTPVGGIVETVFADLFLGTGIDAQPLPEERVLAVGGAVTAAGSPAPCAVVRLRGAPGSPTDGLADDTVADGLGQFSFSGLRAGEYRLQATHPSHPTPPPVPVTLPLAGGHVDLNL